MDNYRSTRPGCRPLSLTTLALVASIGLGAPGGPAAGAEELVDPAARSLLEGMSESLGAAPTLRFTAATLFDDLEKSGVKLKRGIVQEITVSRPNRLHFKTTREDGPSREGWYDGKTLTVAVPAQRIYARIEAPGSLDELLDLLQERYSVNLPVVDLLYADLHSQLAPHLLSGVHYGQRRIDGRAVEHVSFETTPADLQIWIDSSQTPLPRRMVVTFTALDGAPEYLVHLDGWSLGEYAPDALFTFHAPEGWTEVELPAR